MHNLLQLVFVLIAVCSYLFYVALRFCAVLCCAAVPRRAVVLKYVSQAIKALKEEGVEVVLMNPNIASVQTNTDTKSPHKADQVRT